MDPQNSLNRHTDGAIPRKEDSRNFGSEATVTSFKSLMTVGFTGVLDMSASTVLTPNEKNSRNKSRMVTRSFKRFGTAGG